MATSIVMLVLCVLATVEVWMFGAPLAWQISITVISAILTELLIISTDIKLYKAIVKAIDKRIRNREYDDEDDEDGYED